MGAERRAVKADYAGEDVPVSLRVPARRRSSSHSRRHQPSGRRTLGRNIISYDVLISTMTFIYDHCLRSMLSEELRNLIRTSFIYLSELGRRGSHSLLTPAQCLTG